MQESDREETFGDWPEQHRVPDPRRLASALATSAIDVADAMDGKGTLTVTTRRDGALVVVEIGDDGPGIPPEVQARLFETFFTTKPPGKGTGLGLDITWRTVVNRHGGGIRVESKPGDTRFVVSLPVVAPAVGGSLTLPSPGRRGLQ